MEGMQTLDASRSEEVYLHLDEVIEQAKHVVHCYSRLPMRQLLRYISANSAEMWWLSEHDSPRAVTPEPDGVFEHITANTRNETSLVVLEGIDWLVRRSDETAVLTMLQNLDALARERGFGVVLAGDSLSLKPMFWARMCSLAPKSSAAPPAIVFEEITTAAEDDQNPSVLAWNDEQDHEENLLVHLVNLPRAGFTQTVLTRRMLQWKRMGFDLAALEPAMATKDTAKAHAIYASVEQDIVRAIDALRLMEEHSEQLTVSERELFNYRFMALNGVEDASEELLLLLSTR